MAEAIDPSTDDRQDQRLQTRMVCDRVIIGAGSAIVGIRRILVQHEAAADYVVRQDQRAWARQFEREGQVLDVARLVRVDEDHVKRLAAQADEIPQGVICRADANIHQRAEARPFQVPECDLGVLILAFESDENTIRRKRPRQPRRAVTTQGADFENPLRSRDLRKQVQQLALVGRHVDGRKTGSIGIFRDFPPMLGQCRREEVLDISVDSFDQLLV